MTRPSRARAVPRRLRPGCSCRCALRGAHIAALQPQVSLEPATVGRVDFISAVPEGPLIAFRDASPGTTYGKLAVVQLSRPDAPRRIAALSCERVHYASGFGVCMADEETRLLPRPVASVFDRSFQVRHTIGLTGSPIRARVAPGGRRAALTVFERGHSYAEEDLDEDHRDRHRERPPARGSRILPCRRTATRSSRSISISGASPSPPTGISSLPRSRHTASGTGKGSVDARRVAVVRSALNPLVVARRFAGGVQEAAEAGGRVALTRARSRHRG